MGSAGCLCSQQSFYDEEFPLGVTKDVWRDDCPVPGHGDPAAVKAAAERKAAAQAEEPPSPVEEAVQQASLRGEETAADGD
jgi:hypothetical protein